MKYFEKTYKLLMEIRRFNELTRSNVSFEIEIPISLDRFLIEETPNLVLTTRPKRFCGFEIVENKDSFIIKNQ